MNKRQYTVEETFELFWSHWHDLSKQRKTDKEAAFKHWKKLSLKEQRLAYVNARKFIHTIIRDTGSYKYIKKARTYLKDKNFNDEFYTVAPKSSGQLTFISPYADK